MVIALRITNTSLSWDFLTNALVFYHVAIIRSSLVWPILVCSWATESDPVHWKCPGNFPVFRTSKLTSFWPVSSSFLLEIMILNYIRKVPLKWMTSKSTLDSLAHEEFRQRWNTLNTYWHSEAVCFLTFHDRMSSASKQENVRICCRNWLQLWE